jgi:hypothetical protein
MKVTVSRRGGYAGFDETLAKADLADVPGERAGTVQDLLRDLEARALRPGDAVGADFLRYDVEISDGGGASRSFSIPDMGDPEDQAVQGVTSLVEALSGV